MGDGPKRRVLYPAALYQVGPGGVHCGTGSDLIVLIAQNVEVGNFKVPDFIMKRGQTLRVEIPFSADTPEDVKFTAAVRGQIELEGLVIPQGGVGWAAWYRAYRPNRLVRIFYEPSVIRELRRFYNAELDPTMACLKALDIPEDIQFVRLPFTRQVILGIELASRLYSFVVYDTSGLDPLGEEQVEELARSKALLGIGMLRLNYAGTPR